MAASVNPVYSKFLELYRLLTYDIIYDCGMNEGFFDLLGCCGMSTTLLTELTTVVALFI